MEERMLVRIEALSQRIEYLWGLFLAWIDFQITRLDRLSEPSDKPASPPQKKAPPSVVESHTRTSRRDHSSVAKSTIDPSLKMASAELEIEFQAAIPRLQQFGLTAIRAYGRIQLLKYDESKTSVCTGMIQRIELCPIQTDTSGNAYLEIICHQSHGPDIHIRSVKFVGRLAPENATDEQLLDQGYFSIQEKFPVNNAYPVNNGYVETWRVYFCYTPEATTEQGLTVFFSNYGANGPGISM